MTWPPTSKAEANSPVSPSFHFKFQIHFHKTFEDSLSILPSLLFSSLLFCASLSRSSHRGQLSNSGETTSIALHPRRGLRLNAAFTTPTSAASHENDERVTHDDRRRPSHSPSSQIFCAGQFSLSHSLYIYMYVSISIRPVLLRFFTLISCPDLYLCIYLYLYALICVFHFDFICLGRFWFWFWFAPIDFDFGLPQFYITLDLPKKSKIYIWWRIYKIV